MMNSPRINRTNVNAEKGNVQREREGEREILTKHPDHVPFAAAISIIDNVNSHIRTAWNPKRHSRRTVMQVRVGSLCSLRTRHWR